MLSEKITDKLLITDLGRFRGLVVFLSEKMTFSGGFSRI